MATLRVGYNIASSLLVELRITEATALPVSLLLPGARIPSEGKEDILLIWFDGAWRLRFTSEFAVRISVPDHAGGGSVIQGEELIRRCTDLTTGCWELTLRPGDGGQLSWNGPDSGAIFFRVEKDDLPSGIVLARTLQHAVDIE